MFQTSETQKCTLANVKRRKKILVFSKQKTFQLLTWKEPFLCYQSLRKKLVNFHLASCSLSFWFFCTLFPFLQGFCTLCKNLFAIHFPIRICYALQSSSIYLCFPVLPTLSLLKMIDESSISFQVSKYTAHSLTNNSSKHLKWMFGFRKKRRN